MKGEIGKRAAEAIRQTAYNNDSDYEDELKRLNISRQMLYGWERNNFVPTGKTLQILALAGYDVHYILTGVRK